MLVLTSATGPSPSGSPVETVSCSSVYQPSWARRSPTVAATSTSPVPQWSVHALPHGLGIGERAGLTFAAIV